MERNTVPFHIGTTIQDLTTQYSARGVIRIEDTVLIIEFRETRVEMETMKSEKGPVREIPVPMEDVESIEVGRRWPWGAGLQIRARKMSSLADVPGATGNEVRLRIRRRDYDRARELCVATSLLLAGEDIRRLEGGEGGSGRVGGTFSS